MFLGESKNKGVLLVFLFLLYGVVVVGQSQVELRVEKVMEEMNEVLDLSPEISSQVYDVLLERAIVNEKVKEEFGAGDPVVFKQEYRKAMKPINKRFFSLLGKENKVKWRAHLKSLKESENTAITEN